jgi:hypothetical protein
MTAERTGYGSRLASRDLRPLRPSPRLRGGARLTLVSQGGGLLANCYPGVLMDTKTDKSTYTQCSTDQCARCQFNCPPQPPVGPGSYSVITVADPVQTKPTGFFPAHAVGSWEPSTVQSARTTARVPSPGPLHVWSVEA